VKALFPALLIGAITAAIAEWQGAGWWQIFALAWFWSYLEKNNFQAEKKQALLGWAFGFGYFCVGLWWLYISLHDVGGMPMPLATLGVALLAAFLALYTSLAVWLGTRFHYRSYSAISWAAAWTLAEWLRGNLLTGFPWIGFGDTQVQGPFVGVIPIFGSLGATFAVLWAAYQIGSVKRRLIAPLISLGLAVLFSSFLENSNYTQPLGKMLEVRLLQGNFPQSMHYNPQASRERGDYYLNALTQKPADLIISPETAFEFPQSRWPSDYAEKLAQFSKETKSHLLIGTIGEVNSQFSNRAVGINPEGMRYTYDKEHLVPFGEYVPPGFQWFIDAMRVPLSSFAIGKKDQPNFAIARNDQPNIHAAITICYEDVFGNELAARIRKLSTPTNLIVNMTNLAWFGDSQAPDQQLRLARLRSLETGLPTVRATNTGATAIINERGELVQRLPGFKQDNLIGSVQARSGQTPFVRWGNAPLLSLVVIILISSALRYRRDSIRSSFF